MAEKRIKFTLPWNVSPEGRLTAESRLNLPESAVILERNEQGLVIEMDVAELMSYKPVFKEN